MADIIHRIGIRAPAAKVHDAVATARGIADWWARDTTATADAGGTVDVRFTDAAGKEIGSMRFEVTILEPSRTVRWQFIEGPPEWLGTHVSFDLTEANGMTIVLFGHREWKEPVEFMAHCSMKWAVFLLSLRDFLETGTGQPAPTDVKIDDWN